MLISEILIKIIKNNIQNNITSIINNYNKNSFVAFSNYTITSNDNKYYYISDIYLDDHRDYIIRICNTTDKRKFRVIDNNMKSDIEITFTPKLTLIRVDKSESYLDIDIDDSSYESEIKNWFIENKSLGE
jgi:hypothetical protein